MARTSSQVFADRRAVNSSYDEGDGAGCPPQTDVLLWRGFHATVVALERAWKTEAGPCAPIMITDAVVKGVPLPAKDVMCFWLAIDTWVIMKEKLPLQTFNLSTRPRKAPDHQPPPTPPSLAPRTPPSLLLSISSSVLLVVASSQIVSSSLPASVSRALDSSLALLLSWSVCSSPSSQTSCSSSAQMPQIETHAALAQTLCPTALFSSRQYGEPLICWQLKELQTETFCVQFQPRPLSSRVMVLIKLQLGSQSEYQGCCA